MLCRKSTIEYWFYKQLFVYFDTGIPDPPNNVSINVDGNSLKTSWDYHIIKTVNVGFTLSLTFFSPSNLRDMTAEVNDTDSYFRRCEIM